MKTFTWTLFGPYPRHTLHLQWRWPFIRYHQGLCMCGINEILKK